MNKKQTILRICLFLCCVGGGVSLVVQAADTDNQKGRVRADVAPVQNTLYTAECGACHFSYQPGLLPARSWEKILTGLGDHFGENAETNATTQAALRTYLTDQAADRSEYRRSRKINATIPAAESPVRITETRYFQKKHQEIARRTGTQNPKIGSLSRCETCHTQAEQGSFNEHEVQIPGVGRWQE